MEFMHQVRIVLVSLFIDIYIDLKAATLALLFTKLQCNEVIY